MIRTDFPDLSRKRLVRLARDHALDLALDRGYDDPENAGDDRLVVNLLRHEFTDYDIDQSADRHREACEAIAARYPYLAAECARQVAARETAEQDAQQFAEMYLMQQREHAERRREMIAASRRAIVDLTVGQHVVATVRGHVRHGVLIKVARSRVTMEFAIASGASRTAVLYAAQVRPA
jgi:hypothetical protein